MKTIAIMQPTYLPWLGYFEMIARSDEFIIYDHVQFSQRSWQQRNRIRNRLGELWLTVPVRKKGHFGDAINQVEIDTTRKFIDKHLRAIEMSYARHPGFEQIFDSLSSIYQRQHDRLLDLNVDLIRFGMKMFGIDTPLSYSGDMDVSNDRIDALVDVCRLARADALYLPQGVRSYLDKDDFQHESGVIASYQDYEHPQYPQHNYRTFISHLSFIDYLFCMADEQGSLDDPFDFDVELPASACVV